METERLERLEKFVESLPSPEKVRVILFIDDTSFSWLQVIEALKRDDALSLTIEKELEEKLK